MKPEVEKIIDKDRKYVIHGWGYSSTIFVEGRGTIVKDLQGREYIDCMSGSAGPMSLGYANPRVLEAVRKQMTLPHVFHGYVNIPRVELAEKVARISPRGLTKSWFGCGGGDANETALKAAMKYTKKKEVISLYDAYHGMTIGLQALMQPRLREGLPIIPGFRQIPPAYCYRCYYGQDYPGCDYECARALETTIKHETYGDVAAFILEPIQGQAGHVYPPDQEYAKIVRETCEKYGIVVVADEVQTGFGRTGKMWACEYIGLKPDIITAGKIVGGGFPLSIAIMRDDIAENVFRGQDPMFWWHSLTHGGAPFACAIGSAVLDYMLEIGSMELAERMGEYFIRRCNELKNKHQIIGDVRGPGLYTALELVKDRETKEKATDEALKVVKNCFERGVIFGLSLQAGIGNVIKTKPPFTITQSEAKRAIDILDDALENAK
jgi:4-aminobutyrate aminotransferase-like enzyme